MSVLTRARGYAGQHRQGQILGRPFQRNEHSPQAGGLVGWWTGQEVTGDRLENRSVYTAPANFTVAPTWTRSIERGNVLTFDGADDRLQVSRYEAIHGQTLDEMSWSCWVNPFSTGENGANIFLKSSGYRMQLPSTGGMPTNIDVNKSYDVTALAITNNTPLVANVISHIAATFNEDNDNRIKIYVNGILQPLGTDDAGSGLKGNDTGNNLFIGNNNIGSETFDGWIDDFRIYNRALSAGEVYKMFSPQTRWDLFAPITRSFYMRKSIFRSTYLSVG